MKERVGRLRIALFLVAAALASVVLLEPVVKAQLQQSGGGGSSVAVTSIAAGDNNIGNVDVVTLPALAAGTNNIGDVDVLTLPALPSGSNNIGDVDVLTLPALAAGANIIGFVRVLPAGCSLTTPFANTTAQVGTGAGTTVTSTTTCVAAAFANNITNAAVTLRLADRQGTPVIWLGGNADFTIPANSNLRVPVDGIVFTSGITAIAGTATAINLQIQGMQ